MELNKIYNQDCLEGLRQLPDHCVDLVVTDPPYELETQGGGIFDAKGAYKQYGSNCPRKVMKNIANITDGFDGAILDELCRVMKKINIYLWCSQKQLQKYIDYFANNKGCNWDLLCWHKSNPVPSCGNKYLSDTEYCLFFREKGVQLYGTFATKKKYWVQESNTEDNEKWGHPTIKPMNMIQTLIINSSQEGEVVLDPFMGSGTTAVAAIKEKRNYIGYELNTDYYTRATKRIQAEQAQLTLF